MLLTRSRNVAAFLLVLASPNLEAQDSTLHLPLRVHLLRSAQSQALSTTRTPAQIHELLTVANQIWRQAGIQWHVESIITERVPNGSVFDSLIAGLLPVTRPRLLTVFPRDSLLTSGWNLFLIRDYGQIGGGSFFADIVGVVLAERGMSVELLPNARGGGTLAHELGHSLGLQHESCDETRNIMANGCWKSVEVMKLSAQQIAIARQQAAVGRPITVEPDWRDVPPNTAVQQGAADSLGWPPQVRHGVLCGLPRS